MIKIAAILYQHMFFCSLLLCCFFKPGTAISQEIPEELKYTPRGTGRTTGHILDLNVLNPSEAIINFTGTEIIIPGIVGTQVYRSRIPQFRIAPGESIDIPLHGECITVRKPPLGKGQIGSQVTEWITPSSVGAPPIPGCAFPEGFVPLDSSQTDVVLTYPGTDITLGATINFKDHLQQAAPLIFAIEKQIDSSYQEMWETGQINIPVPADRAYQEGKQQVKWHVYSILEGKPYKQIDLESRLNAQLEASLKQPLNKLSHTTRERIKKSVDDIWNMITLVEQNAKVIKRE